MPVDSRNVDKSKQRDAIEGLKVKHDQIGKRRSSTFTESENRYYRQHGNWLNVFLAVATLAGIFQIMLFIGAIGEVDALNAEVQRLYADSSFIDADELMTDSTIYMVGIVLQAGVLLCIGAIWYWKFWGYYGVVFMYCLSFLAALVSGNLIAAGGSLFGAYILHSLIEPERPMYDDI